jgi:hypothetical protein
VAPGTHILGFGKVDKLRRGDKLLGYSRWKGYVWQRVERVETAFQSMVMIRTCNRSLYCSRSHPVAVGWMGRFYRFRPAAQVQPGETVVCDVSGEAAEERVLEVKDYGFSTVYSITTDSRPHTFFANGVLSHNKRYVYP